jgi:pimeloyl-ACP methyl ester carboxylesterase
MHRMAYTEWGDPENPAVLLCVHGLTRTGRDFDTVAATLSRRYRVVCPDVVGRGQSDWLDDQRRYVVDQYVADMVTLIARLGVEQVDWFGTSMGGLIGMVLASVARSPISRLLLNDIGPTMEAEALQRIGSYVGKPISFASEQEGIDYLTKVSISFGSHTPEQWRELNRPLLRERDGQWGLHYDPRIAAPLLAETSELAAQGQAALWRCFESIEVPVLVVRGAESDLLTPATVEEMRQRGRHVTSVEVAGVGHAPSFIDPVQVAIADSFFAAPARLL